MHRNDGAPRDGAGPSIVVIGGYGAVGGATATALGTWFPGRVVAAGRDPAKAADLAASTGGAVRAARVDAGDPAQVERLLDDAAVVVMCVERANAAVARACLGRGVHYVDITASTPLIRAITALDPLARRTGATAVLSVGVAPGLTNLLARHCAERLPSAETVDVSLLLGMGGDHGPDSVRWIVEQLTAPDRPRGPAGRRARVRLGEREVRTVHPFPFSDQYEISEALGVPATTRICFDSALVTSALFGLRTVRFFDLARRLRAEPLLVSALTRVHLGSDRFVVHVAASDAGGGDAGRGDAERGDAGRGTVSSTVTGRDTCRATAVVTAQVARLLLTEPAPPGVVHIDRLLPAGPFLDELERHRMTVTHHDHHDHHAVRRPCRDSAG
ncbi:saccharopine dehydrogenase NADP-binding domain-containing protein [Nonomuraea sp. MCN248]|uniref:Saccharopine dehydrogenase NADP-binding domain-containing protein n=1 Tax=Nonomuraea corallina TaxID=2989783 RepID=A0ABT4SL24_9ACTN|nr:saccharopine dehydrogenase NADP-binding domain-containing protein [Nonomuraea corallina]MDA0637889.1 saccharopine dehydrogenase NADP-binding domain-containing protein [Nonomuraea corallina]